MCRADGHGLFGAPLQYAGPGGVLPAPLASAVSDQMCGTSSDIFVRIKDHTWHALIAKAAHHDRIKGALCVARTDQDGPWDDEDRALLADAADHLGIALAQIEGREKLEELSRTDELTKLFNRRAALFYVDLDNFEKVNDIGGHQQGDEALKMLASLLVRTSRAGDVVARLGGDEFSMGLEEMDQSAAIAKAEALLAESKILQRFSGTEEFSLGISVGIAVTDPDSDEPFDGLVARADETMYSSMRGGKGRYALSPGPGRAPIEQSR
ncbi:MAG: diguanylate cyclase [Alphaproteobacteria bacterium]|nr:diguanylate cyclase [Alphaproteobacteria bacterium]